jgi:hypothetical protein
MICDVCKKDFKSISSLNKHKKTAKYCIGKQIQIEIEYLRQENTIVKNVQEDFNRINEENIILKLELLKCKDELSKCKDELSKCKDDILVLKTENNIYLNEHIDDKNHIKMLSARKNVTNTNIHNNLKVECIIENEPQVKEKIESNLTINHIADGQKGIAMFVVENLLKDKEGNLTYICSDPSRQYFKYKNQNGELVKDVKAKKLTNSLCNSNLIQKTCDIANDWWTDKNGDELPDRFVTLSSKALEIIKLNSNNSTFCNELSTLTST